MLTFERERERERDVNLEKITGVPYCIYCIKVLVLTVSRIEVGFE